MARFFTTPGAPLTFPVTQQGGGVAQARRRVPADKQSDEQIKRGKISAAYANSLEDVSPKTMEVPPGENSAGMQLNIPQTGDMQSNKEKYYKNLEALGLSDFAREEEKRAIEITQNEEILKNKKIEFKADGIGQFIELAFSGARTLALQTGNKYTSKNERILDYQLLDKDNIRVFSEDTPDGEVISRSSYARARADAKTRAERWFPPVLDEKTGLITKQNALTGDTKLLTKIDGWKDIAAKDTPQVAALYQDFARASQGFLEKSSAWTRMEGLATERNKAAGVAMVYNLAVIMQPPGSRVTDQDFAQASTARPLLEQWGISWELVRNAYSAEGLTEANKMQIVKTARNLYLSTKIEQKDKIEPYYRERAKASGLSDRFKPEALYGAGLDAALKESEEKVEKDIKAAVTPGKRKGYPSRDDLEKAALDALRK